MNKCSGVKTKLLPILKSNSCLTSTALLMFLLGLLKFCTALFIDGPVISENIALKKIKRRLRSAQTMPS